MALDPQRTSPTPARPDDSRLNEALQASPAMGSRKLLKVKAHQADELAEEEFAAQQPEMQLRGFVVAGNRSVTKRPTKLGSSRR